MEIRIIPREQLPRTDRVHLDRVCKNHPEFILIDHGGTTVLINRDWTNPEQMRELIKELLTFEYTDETGENGRTFEECMTDIVNLSNPEAGRVALDIWHWHRTQERIASAKARAAEWYCRANHDPDELDADIDFLRQLYWHVQRSERETIAQRIDKEHSFNAAVRALYQYGYERGLRQKTGREKGTTNND